MLSEILQLSWQIQLCLASGYAAYSVAHLGIRAHHSTTDVIFSTLAFSAIGSGILYLSLISFSFHPVLAGCSVFLLTVAAAVVWRRWVKRSVYFLLRKIGLIETDDKPTAWLELFDLGGRSVTQIAVQLDDGGWLRCDNAGDFENLRPPLTLGADGSVLMYLTHTEDTEGAERPVNNVKHTEWGARVTYVPAHRIRTINIRTRK